MPDLSIQFHALPSELVQFVEACLTAMDLHVVAISFPPYAVREMSSAEIPKFVLEGLCHELAFTENEPCLPASTGGEFAEKNPDALYLAIGKQTPQGLKESWLACRTFGTPVNPKWKEIASKLRSLTKAGALAINPTTGATSRSRNRRFTKGAK